MSSIVMRSGSSSYRFNSSRHTSHEHSGMRVRIGCKFDYASDAALPLVMLVKARPDGDHTTLYQSRWTDPDVPIRDYVDTFGNHCWRLLATERAPAGEF